MPSSLKPATFPACNLQPYYITPALVNHRDAEDTESTVTPPASYLLPLALRLTPLPAMQRRSQDS